MRTEFVNELIELAKKERNIELVVGDLGYGVFEKYWSSLPDQFTNAGIAEQNMMAMAAGMAREGKIVFVYSIGNFPTLRCLEQIRNDCAYHNANVKIVAVGGGFPYGSLGMSHQATEDIAIMRALPNVTVFCPGDPVEAKAVVKAAVDLQGTCYIRLGRGKEKSVHEKLDNFEVGDAIKIYESQGKEKRIAIFSTGAILDEVADAVLSLEKEGVSVEQYSFPTVKPIDSNVIEDCARRCALIVTVEEHNIIGGFGSAVSEIVASNDINTRVLRIGLTDVYCSIVGDQKYLREQYSIDSQSIVKKVMQALSILEDRR